jgi:hypothetical protein
VKTTYTLSLPCEMQPEAGFIEMQEIDVDFDITADIFYDPGVYSGAWENSYPASGDCDITEIKVLSKVDGLNDADILDALEKQVGTDKITDDLWADYHSQGVDDGPA